MTTLHMPLTAARPEPALACDLLAIPAADREAHTALATSLLFAPDALRFDQPDGTLWQFPIDRYGEVIRFVANERRCCSFFSFAITILPQRVGVQLRIGGDATAAAFLRAGLARHGVPAPSGVPLPAPEDPDTYPVVCDLTTLRPEEDIALSALGKRLLCAEYQERQELPDGYGWRFSPDEYEALVWFIEGDSRCCAFLTHRLEVESTGKGLWLTITGGAAAKAAVGADLARLQEELAKDSRRG